MGKKNMMQQKLQSLYNKRSVNKGGLNSAQSLNHTTQIFRKFPASPRAQFCLHRTKSGQQLFQPCPAPTTGRQRRFTRRKTRQKKFEAFHAAHRYF